MVANARSLPLEQESDNNALEEEALELRMALDDQLERVRSLSYHDQLALSVEEQLSQLIMLVSQYSEDALKQAVLMTTVFDADDPSYTGRYLLHLACDTNAPFEVIRFFLDSDPTKLSVQHKDKWGDLPIHTACSRKNYTDIVKILLESDANRNTIFMSRIDGSLAIHTACRYNAPPAVFELLLDCDVERKTLFTESTYGQVPLHVACRCNLNYESLQLLLDYDVEKKSVLRQDNADRLPIHVAYLYKSHVKSIEIILKGMIFGRIERVGLENWKRDLREMMQKLNVRERDFDASDKVELTRSVLEKFMERAFLLELAIWKNNCFPHDCGLSDTAAGSKSMKELSSAYKSERRITSGAEIIIPHVLAFVEDEPLVAMLDAFRQW